MDVVVRSIEPGEALAFVRSERIPFLEPATDDPVDRVEDERRASRLETARAWVAEVEGRFVGQANIYSLDVTLPAAPGQRAPVLPMAGVSGVGVHPTHRRRGILRQLMGQMLDDARQGGEALAGLIASESAIYGRFGFGHATSGAEVTIDRRDAALAAPTPELDIRLVTGEEAAKVLPELFDHQRGVRAGEPSRNPAKWQDLLADRRDERGGANAAIYAVCDEGYVGYRVHDADVLRGDRCRLVIEELRGTSATAEAALWRFVFGIDLVGPVTARRRPVDEPLRWRLADPRQLRVTDVIDWLYLRILDVPAALEARGYRRPGRLVLEVLSPSDPVGGPDDKATGRWVLDAGPDGASCRAARSGESPDVRLPVTDLGSLYLGGVAASVLAAAGRIDEVRVGSLDVADALFATPLAPLTGTGF